MAACRQCGSELPEGARFCPACGTAVEGRRGEERKVVTVLFADLVDSTGLGDGRDPEELRAAVRPQLARMRSALEHHGGTFEKFVGDAVMAVFGAPSTHEDDPERAVRAALAIRDSVRGVRVGVNTGEAVVQLEASSGAGEGIATGDVVTTTFRIEEAADIDSVLVGESTYRATRDAIEYSERRLLQAKGKSEPVAVYEALRARFEQRPAYDGPPLAPLVGRKEELSLILDTLSRARRDRTVQLLTLVGVPGIGKSRLVWELQRAVADEPALVTWRRGRCLPYGDGVTFWALGEMIKAQAGVLESDGVSATEEKLRRASRELIADPGDAAWVEAHLRPLLGLDPGSRNPRDEAFAAWRRALEGLAEQGPLVLVFEDLHWADEGLLDFIDHVADWSADRPILLLCTSRPELRDRRPTWGARANAATVLLSPLSGEETGTLLAFLLRQRLVPAELQAALTARAAGNPLYAEEFVRMLVESGLLYRNGGGWQLRDRELPVPESVQAIIAGRLDGLPPDEKAVLRDAAVVGQGFWPPAVAAVSGLEPSVVDEALHVLEQKEFVRRVRQTAVASQRQYSFHHALVRDVAYGQIPHVDRAEKHCAVAEWIEALGRPEDHAETIAHHYLLALEYARGADQDTSRFAAAARSALADAAARVLALSAHEQAERYYTAALELAPEEPAERGRLLSGLGKALTPAGAGIGELEEASSLLLEADDRGGAAEADVLAARLLLMQGRHEEASDRFDRALALVDGTRESPEKAVVLANVAGFRMASDRGGEAIKLARQALELAERFGLSDLQVSARATIGTARVSMGDVGGVEDLEASIAVADDAGSSEIVRAYLNLGSVLANLGDVRRAAELHGRGREAAERFGDPTRLRWFDAERLYELYWNDAWAEALQLADELLVEAHVGAFDAHLVRGWVRLARDEIDGAADDAERALELGRSFGGPQLLYPALAFAARVRLATGDDAAAGELASELLEAWAQTRERTLPSFWVSDLAFVLHALGRGGELEAAADSSGPRTRWLEAAVAMARGDEVRARELYAEIGSVPG